MAKQKLFTEPFDEGTLDKLELYREYITTWLPVFISKPYSTTVNVFDFFAGMGQDTNGNDGSPLIAIKTIHSYRGWILKHKKKVTLHVNDNKKAHIERLKELIQVLNIHTSIVDVHYYNRDAADLYLELRPQMNNSANLIFFDQFGVKFVTRSLFQEISRMDKTDLLFFTSSNTVQRFHSNPNVTQTLGLDSATIKKIEPRKIHDLVTNAYKEFVPKDVTYYISSFSLQKGRSKNRYGLIFGSRHPLGIEKFLKICWDKDKLSGAANHDIEDDRKKSQLVFFGDDNEGKRWTKVERFEQLMKEKILNGTLATDRDIVIFLLGEGFISKHARPVINSLKKDGKITYKGRLSYSASILYRRPGQKGYKPPTLIKVL